MTEFYTILGNEGWTLIHIGRMLFNAKIYLLSTCYIGNM